MIKIKRTEPKDYLDMMTEAISKIPLYSKEWTNFNPSDPGITLLEVVTALNSLQQNQMGRISDTVKESLLKLMGLEPLSGKCGRVLLAADNVTEDFYLPTDQKFTIGNVKFETNRRSIVHANKINSVFSIASGKYIDCSPLIDRGSTVTVRIFGDRPKAGDQLYLFLDKMPLKDTELIFYFGFDDRYHRVPGGDNHENVFADVTWQYYTQEGFVDLKKKDLTRAFLNGGELRLTIPDMEGAVYEQNEHKGYVLRAVLNRADYDVPPRFNSIHGFLFEVWQKETRSICHTFQGGKPIEVYCDLLEEDYSMVFVKESRNGHYHLYQPYLMGDEKGRVYSSERKNFGFYEFSFNKDKYGYGPCNEVDAVKIVAYNESLMRQRRLDTVLGYDNQEMVLPVSNIVPESFTLLAKRVVKGEEIYDFIRPGRKKDGEIRYILDEREGKIIIEDAGDYIGAELFMCSCAVTMGSYGNVRPGNVFTPVGYESEVVFYNPYSGEGGRLKENLEELTRRFTADLNTPYTAVKRSDYEYLVRSIPDLCIRKVRAISVPEKNEVRIAAMPYADDEFPLLSEIYVKKIATFLDERRVLSTKVSVIQPVYVPVSVSGTIYVKRHYENCREEIEEVIRKHLDYIISDRNFGETLKFDALFRDIEELKCVNHVFELTIKPDNNINASMNGLDVVPVANGLIYPGTINIDVNTFAQNV